jgi:hypothetical protein
VIEKGFRIAKAPAVYLYTRDRHFAEHIRILTRDRMEYFKQTSKPFEGGPRLSDLLRTIFWVVPKTAVRTIAQEGLLYFSLKSIPWRVHSKRLGAASVKHPVAPSHGPTQPNH